MFFRSRRRDVLAELGMSIDDICSHVFAIGASGSGKTSILRILMTAILNHGVGCIWCCVKADEAANAIQVIRGTKMRHRLRHLVPGKFTFNFLSYELEREGGTPSTAARLLRRLNEQMMRAGGDKEESFWSNLFFGFLQHGITIAWLAYRDKVNIEHLYQLVTSTPSSMQQAKSEAFRKSKCFQMIQLAEKNIKNDGEQRAFQLAVGFLLRQQLELGSKARSAAVSQTVAVLSPFLLSPLFETVCADESSFIPEMVLGGDCAVLDFPILTHQQGGVMFQSLITIMVMEAALRRPNPENITAIVRDEAQMLIADPEFEAMVQAVARSHKLACISASQNLPLLQSAFGGDAAAQQLMLALFANYNTKLVLANNCNTTNDYFSSAWGQHREQFIGVSESQPEGKTDFMSMMFGEDQFLFSTNQQLVPRLTPDKFLSLRRGGKANRFLIDAYLTQGGRIFGDSPFTRVTFSQR